MSLAPLQKIMSANHWIDKLCIMLAAIILGSIFFKKAAGTLSIRRPTPVTLAYYFLISCFLAPSFLIATRWFVDWQAQQAFFEDSAVTAFYVTCATFVLFPLLIWGFEKLIFRMNVRYVAKYWWKTEWKTVTGYRDDVLAVWILGALALFSSILLLLLWIREDIPLKLLISGADPLSLATARRKWTASPERWLIYSRTIIGYWITPISSLIAFGYCLQKRCLKYWFLWGVTFCIAVIWLTHSLERFPLALLLTAMAYLVIIKRKNLSFKLFLFMASVTALIAIFAYSMTTGLDAKNAAIALAIRVGFAQYSGTVLTFDMFPRLHSFLGWQGFATGVLSDILGVDVVQTRYSLLLMRQYNPVGWELGKAGYLCTLFIAEGYAALGVPGIFVSLLVAALWLAFLQWLFFSISKHPVSMGFLSLFVLRVVFFLGDSTTAFLWPSGFVIALLFAVSIVFIIRGRLSLKLLKESK